MRSMPEECALSFVLTLRTTQSLSICLARRGISSEKWTPGTFVGMLRNGPPNCVFGFGSQLSSWLMPPSSQTKSTCLLFVLSASPARAESRPQNAPAAMPAAPSPRKRRRESRWSCGVQRGFDIERTGLRKERGHPRNTRKTRKGDEVLRGIAMPDASQLFVSFVYFVDHQKTD